MIKVNYKAKVLIPIPAIALKSYMIMPTPQPLRFTHFQYEIMEMITDCTCSAYLRVILRIKSDKIHRSP